MQGGLVVPEHDVAHLPVVLVAVLGAREVGAQALDEARAAFVGIAHHLDLGLVAQEQAAPPALRVGAHQRMRKALADARLVGIAVERPRAAVEGAQEGVVGDELELVDLAAGLRIEVRVGLHGVVPAGLAAALGDLDGVEQRAAGGLGRPLVIHVGGQLAVAGVVALAHRVGDRHHVRRQAGGGLAGQHRHLGRRTEDAAKVAREAQESLVLELLALEDQDQVVVQGALQGQHQLAGEGSGGIEAGHHGAEGPAGRGDGHVGEGLGLGRDPGRSGGERAEQLGNIGHGKSSG